MDDLANRITSRILPAEAAVIGASILRLRSLGPGGEPTAASGAAAGWPTASRDASAGRPPAA